MADSDLDDLLLEAAGRPSNTRGNRNAPPSSRRRNRDSNDDSDGDRGYSARKPSGSQVPLKKRLDTGDRGNAHTTHEDDDQHGYDKDPISDNDSIGSDLYTGEDDRQNLARMSELQRESILADRAEKRSDRELHDKLRRRRSPEHPQPRGTRSSARTADRAAARGDALNEIRAKQKRQHDPDGYRKGDSGNRGYSPVKRKSFSAIDSSYHSDEEDSTGDGGMDDSDDEQESEFPTFEEVKGITIRRSKLAKWFMEPFFDELIVGCFVRVGIGRSRSGPIYRLCIVRNVDASDSDRLYKLDNKTTYKYLNVVWGNESSAARWQMAMISDSSPLKEEYDQWIREVERSGGRMPSKQDVLEKEEAIQKINDYVYSAETVKQMLQEKKSATWRPLNVAAEKDRLRREMEVAKTRHDDEEVEKIQARIQELEAARESQEKDSKAIRLAEMNRKNRVENFKNASELKSNSLAGQAGYDPFSRRWTRSRNYYVGKGNGEAAEGENADANTASVNATDNQASSSTGEAGMVVTAAALEAAAGAGKLVDTRAPIDQGTETYTLHNFELPISLAVLQRFGGAQGAQAGFLARKQMIEATVGVQVPENDGRRHALTLTVGDYKRRRGLL
ncbi:hypothetical protein LIER_28808 [Lithospermum erythrorhizon]|uniref:Plus3 domain-containing protein n=1 Tax=Lithospermum erythrorhizon TaxID=34254 RepID=A0AAV3RK76_LITER